MRMLIPFVLAVLCFVGPAQAAGQRSHRSTGQHRKQSGTATATCQDGTTSYSAHRRGTCSHHGGVKLGRTMACRSSWSVKCQVGREQSVPRHNEELLHRTEIMKDFIRHLPLQRRRQNRSCERMLGHCDYDAATWSISEAYWLPSSVFLMDVSAFCRFETDRPTAAFRTIDPLTPVRPACSEPMAMIK